MKREIIGDLYDANTRFDSPFEQANGTEGSRQPGVTR
jgi:hypothetical protein